MSKQVLEPNQRLQHMNDRDVRDLVGERLEQQAMRMVGSMLVTVMHAEGDTLRGRVREKQGLTAMAIKLRLPDGHPALAWTLEQLEPLPADQPPLFSLHEAALLCAWAHNYPVRAQRYEIILENENDFEEAPDLSALDALPASILWQGLRGPYAQLSALLLQQRVNDVRRIAKRLGIRSTKESKETLIPQILPRLMESDTLQNLHESLSPLHRGLLTTLVLCDGGLSFMAVCAATERLGIFDSAEANIPQIRDALSSLNTAGLVFSADPGNEHMAPYQVPLEVAAAYRPRLSDLPHPPQPVTDATPAMDATPDLLTTLRGLVLLLRQQPRSTPAEPETHILEQRVPSLLSWYNDPQELDELARKNVNTWNLQYDRRIQLQVCAPPPLLAEPDLNVLAQELGSTPGTIHLLLRLLNELRLLEPYNPMLTLTGEIDQLLARPIDVQRRLLVTTWAYMLGWSEVHDLNNLTLRRNIYGTLGIRSDQLYAELAATRRFVLRLLRALEPEQWYRLDDLITLVRSIQPNFLSQQRIERDSGERRWWLARGNAKKPLDPTQDSDWNDAEARLLKRILTGPLRWLGILDVGGTTSELVRLTAEGAVLLGLRSSGERQEQLATPAIQVVVESDPTRIVLRIALADTTAPILHLIERVAQTQGLEQGGVLVFQITPSTLRDGMLRGETIASIQAFMQQHARDLPPDIPALLEQWGNGFGQATIYTGMVLIELASDLLLPELRRSTRIERALLEQLSPRMILVDPAAADDLFNELVAKGYTPRRVNL